MPQVSSTKIAVARGLSKSFGDGASRRVVLDKLSFTLSQGEFISVLGKSGSGKSTLLGILGGLDKDYGGELSLFGEDLRHLEDDALSLLRGRRVGFVFQAFHLLGHLSVLENVLLPALFRSERIDHTPRALSLLERLGIAEMAAEHPRVLSGGQRQRVAIARALLFSPDLLLCDEPTGNLDAATGQALLDLLAELHREGLTIVAVTHEERLAAISSRRLHLVDGVLQEQAAA